MRADRLTALTALTALAACGVGGIARPGNSGGTGSSGGTALAEAVVGSWQRTLILQQPDDIITSETVWTFRDDGSCERSVTSSSVSSGISDTQTSACIYELNGNQISITFDGTTVPATFTAAVTGDSLFLDGVAFQRT